MTTPPRTPENAKSSPQPIVGPPPTPYTPYNRVRRDFGDGIGDMAAGLAQAVEAAGMAVEEGESFAPFVFEEEVIGCEPAPPRWIAQHDGEFPFDAELLAVVADRVADMMRVRYRVTTA